MAPLKTDEIQNDTLTHRNLFLNKEGEQMELHPEAYKVKGPSPDKMQSVSSSLRKYANGLYGLL
ncbi:hypothetical protein [Pedobacter sp. Leaf194]|uniref:hypothetical protein n=1 Tax=Pedobacter sp. Leaf194 TaxID=1736297 RepID=UPI0007029720|nr:hypothetical protein [Pedobacter sp. Leaf194]KQS36331.1 hypothetical protein ASG14_13000 [Pedobacter sp. Leaf194]